MLMSSPSTPTQRDMTARPSTLIRTYDQPNPTQASVRHIRANRRVSRLSSPIPEAAKLLPSLPIDRGLMPIVDRLGLPVPSACRWPARSSPTTCAPALTQDKHSAPTICLSPPSPRRPSPLLPQKTTLLHYLSLSNRTSLASGGLPSHVAERLSRGEPRARAARQRGTAE